MNKVYGILLILCITLNGLLAQSITGKWKTIDDETGEARSIIEIYNENGKVYGKIVDILNPEKKNAVCKNCEGKEKDQPIAGMVIIQDMVKDEDEYNDGTILNPDNGKTYKCTLKLEENKDVLRVRGYLAFFYKTQYWERVK